MRTNEYLFALTTSWLMLSCSGDTSFLSSLAQDPAKVKDDVSIGGSVRDQTLDYLAGDAPNPDGLASLTDCDVAEQRGFIKTVTKNLVWDDNFRQPGKCTWENPHDGFLKGYRYQPKVLDIPNSRVVCRMNFKSEEKLQYDDAIILSINDKLLMWGNIVVDPLDLENGLYKYEWNKIKGASMKNSPTGCAFGSTECSVPRHDSPDLLKLAFNDEMNFKIMSEIERYGAEFNLRAFGDNDDDTDCTHKKLDLKIQYSYFVK